MFLLFQEGLLSKEIPQGEKELLHWIIYILIAILIIVVTYFIKKQNKSDKIIMDISKESIVHISKTNEVITQLSGVVKETGESNRELKSAIESHNDYLPKLIKALSGKDII